MTDTAGRKVLITGVSSGLGEALAGLYLKEGWKVYGLSRTKPELLSGDDNFSFVHVDLAEFQSVGLGLRELIDTNSLDLVILNAGIIGNFGPMRTSDLENLQQVMDVNVWANKVIIDFLDSENVAIKQLVAISSGASRSGGKGWNGYGISKAALNMMIKLYAVEMPDTHFCALAPGLIDSPMQDYLCTIEDSGYPVLDTLKAARNSEVMPKPEVAAGLIAEAISKLPSLVKSGDYADVRKLE